MPSKTTTAPDQLADMHALQQYQFKPSTYSSCTAQAALARLSQPMSTVLLLSCRVAQKHDLQLPSQLVGGTIRGAPGAAVGLLEYLYEQLTGKK